MTSRHHSPGPPIGPHDPRPRHRPDWRGSANLNTRHRSDCPLPTPSSEAETYYADERVERDRQTTQQYHVAMEGNIFHSLRKHRNYHNRLIVSGPTIVGSQTINYNQFVHLDSLTKHHSSMNRHVGDDSLFSLRFTSTQKRRWIEGKTNNNQWGQTPSVQSMYIHSHTYTHHVQSLRCDQKLN